MAQPLPELAVPDHASMLITLAAGEGCASHGWLHAPELNAGPQATRNLSDLLHLLSVLHGQPSLVDLAAQQNVWTGADAWFAAAVEGFGIERDYIARLTVAAGPAPASPAQANTLSTVLSQAQALETIARSDRFGCAIGAVCGLLFDWQGIRAMLDTAADRLGLHAAPMALPDEAATAAMLDAIPERPRLDRTLSFGARQVHVQHCGLLDLLQTRAEARAEL